MNAGGAVTPRIGFIPRPRCMMDVNTYDQTHELADRLYTELQRLYREQQLTKVENKLKEISGNLPRGYSLTINFSVEVFD